MQTALSAQTVTRPQIEDFLYHEAALLDDWRLQEWLNLLTEDVTYEVPATDLPDGDPKQTLFLIADDAARVQSRVQQLLGKSAWAENPRSRTRRLITNVRVREISDETLHITANFAVYRMRRGQIDTYVGRYEYALVLRDGELKIQKRKAILDLEALQPHGKISIIL